MTNNLPQIVTKTKYAFDKRTHQLHDLQMKRNGVIELRITSNMQLKPRPTLYSTFTNPNDSPKVLHLSDDYFKARDNEAMFHLGETAREQAEESMQKQSNVQAKSIKFAKFE